MLNHSAAEAEAVWVLVYNENAKTTKWILQQHSCQSLVSSQLGWTVQLQDPNVLFSDRLCVIIIS